MPPRHTHTRATRLDALTHPIWLGALLVLALNDHLWKHAAPSALTGKLSDVAGLVVASVLLAALLPGQRRGARLWWGAGLTTLVFCAINLDSQAAAWWDALLGWRTTVDPTDLLAAPLAALLLVAHHRTLDAWRARAGATPRAMTRALAMCGVLLCAASGSDDPLPWYEDYEEFAELTILNRTNEAHTLTFTSLDRNSKLDCALIAQNPGLYLQPNAFDSATRVEHTIFSGQEVSVEQFQYYYWQDVQECSAIKVRGEQLPEVVIFWQRRLPTRAFYPDADIPKHLEPSAQTITIEADYTRSPTEQLHSWRHRPCDEPVPEWCGYNAILEAKRVPAQARYTWASPATQTFHFAVPLAGERPPVCVLPEGVSWNAFPLTLRAEILDLTRQEECALLLLESQLTGEATARGDWAICNAPEELLAMLTPAPDRNVALQFQRKDTRNGDTLSLLWTIASVEDNTLLEQRTITLVNDLPARQLGALVATPDRTCTPTGSAPTCGSSPLPVHLTTADGAPIPIGAWSTTTNTQRYIARAQTRAWTRAERANECGMTAVLNGVWVE